MKLFKQKRFASDSPFLIVGLGNPGTQYRSNRHNIGFICLDALARNHDITVRRRRFKARVGEGRIGDQRVVLAKPLTFMNSSGESLSALSHWYHTPPERILIIHDDLDLPFAKIRVRPGGGSGGHNGLKSIIGQLGNGDFCRVRIGIGRPTHGDPVDYVLNDFDRDQAPCLDAIQERIVEIVAYWLDHGVKKTMNAYNGLSLSESRREG